MAEDRSVDRMWNTGATVLHGRWKWNVMNCNPDATVKQRCKRIQARPTFVFESKQFLTDLVLSSAWVTQHFILSSH